MAEKQHWYPVTVTWTGNTGTGTKRMTGYARDHEIAVGGKPVIPASSDPAFRGDSTRWNPEELLVASLSQCHMLWYLSSSVRNKIVVTGYVDHAEGVMIEDERGSGRFASVVLRPRITLEAGSDVELADSLHHTAHEMCFIANSVNFPVTVEATYVIEE